LNIKIFIINIEAWTNHTTLHYILVLLHQSATQGDQSITCTALRSRVNSLTTCSFDAVPVSLRGRHVCAIIPSCASPCDVSEFFDTEIPKAYCWRCSIFFFKWRHVQHPMLVADVLLRSKLIVENHIYKILLLMHSQAPLPTYSQAPPHMR